MTHVRGFVVLACALSLAAVGCSSSSSSGSAAEGGIGVTEQDFSIAVSPSSATAGEVTFNVTNNGPSTHEFLVVKSDEDPGSLTVDKDGIVPEDSLDLIDELEDVAPNTAPTLTVDLEAGSYILMCNIAGHYQQGMHTGFTVS
jgi:uncharacterized cupredoxin-like copper-binding protein